MKGKVSLSLQQLACKRSTPTLWSLGKHEASLWPSCAVTGQGSLEQWTPPLIFGKVSCFLYRENCQVVVSIKYNTSWIVICFVATKCHLNTWHVFVLLTATLYLRYSNGEERKASCLLSGQSLQQLQALHSLQKAQCLQTYQLTRWRDSLILGWMKNTLHIHVYPIDVLFRKHLEQRHAIADHS